MADDQKLRADAKENRDRILDVARDALAADPAASLNSIAKAAGVGTGTLYRHFPSREALVLGVYRKEIDELVALAPVLTADQPPLQAFSLWCDRLAHYGRMKHGVAAVLHTAMSAQDFQETYWPMVGAMDHLLQVCVASEDFKPGADAEDVLLLLGFLWRIKPGPSGEARARRLLALTIRGLSRSLHSPSESST